tara:strand:+ start:463 stop:633 length:171 start_codon:yes stop_codon:yes gene_type:complete
MNELIKKDINRKCENAYEIKIKALQEKIKRLEYENKQLIVREIALIKHLRGELENE